MVFNIHTAPFDNETVRQAFNYAIDRQKVLDIVAGGQGQVVYTPLSPSMMVIPIWKGLVTLMIRRKQNSFYKRLAIPIMQRGLAEKDGVLFEVVLSSDSTEGKYQTSSIASKPC